MRSAAPAPAGRRRPVPRLERAAPAQPGSVPGLRHAIRDFAAGAGLPEDQVSCIALAVTEAVTNAVLHAFVDRPPGTVRVVVEPDRECLVVRVIDDGRGLTPRYDSPGLGLGLPTIGRLCSELDIASGPGGTGTEVRMFFEAPGLRPEATAAPPATDPQTKRLQDILGALAEAVTVHDREGRIVYANRAAAELLGAASADEVVAAPPGAMAARFQISREDGTPIAYEDLPHRQVFAGREPEPLVTRSVHLPTGRASWLRTTARPLHGEPGEELLVVSTIQDVTEARDAERRQRFLARAGEELALSLDLSETFARIAGLAVPALADWCAIDLVGPDGELHRAALSHVDERKVALGRRLHERYPPDLRSDIGIAKVLRTGEPEFIPELPDSVLAAAAQDEEHLRLLRGLGVRSVIIAPMTARGRTSGVLTLVTAESGRVFSSPDVALANDVARRAAIAVDNARLYAEREPSGG